MDDNLNEESGSASTGSTQAGLGQKRKRTLARNGGRIANGEDFWSRVDAWFSEEIAKRDNDLSGPLWKL